MVRILSPWWRLGTHNIKLEEPAELSYSCEIKDLDTHPSEDYKILRN